MPILTADCVKILICLRSNIYISFLAIQHSFLTAVWGWRGAKQYIWNITVFVQTIGPLTVPCNTRLLTPPRYQLYSNDTIHSWWWPISLLKFVLCSTFPTFVLTSPIWHISRSFWTWERGVEGEREGLLIYPTPHSYWGGGGYLSKYSDVPTIYKLNDLHL